jgi:3-dehydroquinate synthase
VEFDPFGQNDLPDPKSALLVTDENLYHHYPNLIEAYRHIRIPAGEESKNPKQLFRLYDWLMEMKADRYTTLIAFGGGVVCDLAAYAASTYMRGMPLVLVPTSLLAMADAAVGGKNGINYGGIKNIIGTIRQPDKTIIKSGLLKTLPREHYFNGLAEVIKTALIMDANLFETLERSVDKLLDRDTVSLDAIVYQTIKNKLKLVELDEHDTGQRHILNFGHTLGHAIEMEDDMLHGLAVSKGMVAALRLSRQQKLSESDYNRSVEILKAYSLPVDFTMSDAYLSYLKLDKKRKDKGIRFVFLDAVGKARVDVLDFKQIKSLMYAT